jgi:hypothetical protein
MYEGSLMSMFEDNGAAEHGHDGKRKPLEGACPICFMDFAPKDKTVWCQTGCGNNVHEVCFKQWARTSLTSQGSIRCVYWWVSLRHSLSVLLPCPPTNPISSQPHKLAIPWIQQSQRGRSSKERHYRTRRLHQCRRAVWPVTKTRYELFSVLPPRSFCWEGVSS